MANRSESERYYEVNVKQLSFIRARLAVGTYPMIIYLVSRPYRKARALAIVEPTLANPLGRRNMAVLHTGLHRRYRTLPVERLGDKWRFRTVVASLRWVTGASAHLVRMPDHPVILLAPAKLFHWLKAMKLNPALDRGLVRPSRSRRDDGCQPHRFIRMTARLVALLRLSREFSHPERR